VCLNELPLSAALQHLNNRVYLPGYPYLEIAVCCGGKAAAIALRRECPDMCRNGNRCCGPEKSFQKRQLTPDFFARSVHEVAPDLIGATFFAYDVGGVIVEVEAYHHTDPAAHSFSGQTPRNAVMFGPPGRVYVYRSYGIHWCINFVCEPAGSASAVLIRALMPTAGIAVMRRRRGVATDRLLCSGPGRLCQALAITGAHNGAALDQPPFTLLARTAPVTIVSGPRIGLSKAADLPWRYGLKGSRFLSRPFRDER
jgi:DNA-3-methyladenine glycosylase